MKLGYTPVPPRVGAGKVLEYCYDLEEAIPLTHFEAPQYRCRPAPSNSPGRVKFVDTPLGFARTPFDSWLGKPAFTKQDVEGVGASWRPPRELQLAANVALSEEETTIATPIASCYHSLPHASSERSPDVKGANLAGFPLRSIVSLWECAGFDEPVRRYYARVVSVKPTVGNLVVHTRP